MTRDDDAELEPSGERQLMLVARDPSTRPHREPRGGGGEVIRVLIVDHHPIVRRGLHEILADTRLIVVGGEASSAAEALAHIRRADCRCDVILIELALPGESGLELLKHVKRDRPDLRALVLTSHSEERYGVRALKAGAAGYLTKESAPAEVLAAIRKVAVGGRWISEALTERLAVAVGSPLAQLPHEALSNRELQVLRLLGSGRTVKRAAQELHLSEKTVSTYRARLLQKMHLRSTAELIRYAIENRLAD